jgi:uncharacterized protein
MEDEFFEWDDEKADSNLRKHGISFEEAKSVFYDLLSVTIPDILHSEDEYRFIITGYSDEQRQIVVAHTDRNDRIRLISTRLATPSEKKKYEQETD